LFRKDPQISWKHLVESHLDSQIKSDIVLNWKTSWLKMTIPAFTWLDYAVVNMTPRYPAANFDWEAEIRYLKSKYTNVFFVGDAKDNLHNLPQIQCATALQLAEVIHNSQVFVGNQSFALSIAEGLGHQYRMVRGDNHTNCDMHTPNETIINA
jgi:ADP-heptose:LPS heptosyltransferase